MHIGATGVGHAWGNSHAKVREAMMHRAEASSQPSKGERLVARHDANNDNKISISELRETKLGRRMSVDKFAKMDSNSDGMLEASEFDKAREGRRGARAARPERPEPVSSSMTAESAVRANMAEYFTEKVGLGPMDVTEEVIKGLDGDGSGALNSEEIAGTRLAQLMGDGFYALDKDKSGSLDQKELTGFIAEKMMERTGGTKPDAKDIAAIDEAEVTEEIAVAEEAVTEAEEVAAEQDVAPAEAVGGISQASGVSEYASRVQKAFENALEMLKDNESQQSYDAVSALYKDVQNIFETT